MRSTERSKKWRVFAPFGALALLALSSLACFAEASDVKGFELRRSYNLKGGEQRSGDQAIVAYTINLEAGSSVDGDVTLTGNRVTLDGQVTGDVVVVADRLIVGDGAHITGDLVACTKNVERGAGAQIDGEFRRECRDSGSVSFSRLLNSGWASWQDSVFFRVGGSIVGALLFGALAALITAIFPRHLVRMSESVYRSPVTAGGIGCLTMLVATGLTVVYGISLLLILPLVLLPFVIVGWLVIGLFSLLGWVALAEPFGIYLLHRFGSGKHPRMIAAAIGGVVLFLLIRIWSVFWFTAWIGLLAWMVLGSVGLGAVILTRLGTKPYPHRHAGSGAD
jgi:hypothetical protein